MKVKTFLSVLLAMFLLAITADSALADKNRVIVNHHHYGAKAWGKGHPGYGPPHFVRGDARGRGRVVVEHRHYYCGAACRRHVHYHDRCDHCYRRSGGYFLRSAFSDPGWSLIFKTGGRW